MSPVNSERAVEEAPLELLATFETLLVPETVYKEVEAGDVPDELADLSYELVEADESRVRAEELDAGERAAIAVAEERDIVLLTDDFAAREAASDAGVEVHVSIGVIALGYARELLDRDEAGHSCEHSNVRRVSS